MTKLKKFHRLNWLFVKLEINANNNNRQKYLKHFEEFINEKKQLTGQKCHLKINYHNYMTWYDVVAQLNICGNSPSSPLHFLLWICDWYTRWSELWQLHWHSGINILKIISNRYIIVKFIHMHIFNYFICTYLLYGRRASFSHCFNVHGFTAMNA